MTSINRMRYLTRLLNAEARLTSARTAVAEQERIDRRMDYDRLERLEILKRLDEEARQEDTRRAARLALVTSSRDAHEVRIFFAHQVLLGSRPDAQTHQ